MAYVTHGGGEMLAQTRAKAQLNFTEVITDRAEVSSVPYAIGSGMGLPKFRDACRLNFESIDTDLGGGTGFEVIDDGDMIWEVRSKLQANFDIIEALP